MRKIFLKKMFWMSVLELINIYNCYSSYQSSVNLELINGDNGMITEGRETAVVSNRHDIWARYRRAPEPVDPFLVELSGGEFQNPDINALRKSIYNFIDKKDGRDWTLVIRYLFDVLMPTRSVYDLMTLAIDGLNRETNEWLGRYGEEQMKECQDLYEELISKLDPVELQFYLKSCEVNRAALRFFRNEERGYNGEIIRHALDDICDENSLNKFWRYSKIGILQNFADCEGFDECVDLFNEMKNKSDELRQRLRNHD